MISITLMACGGNQSEDEKSVDNQPKNVNPVTLDQLTKEYDKVLLGQHVAYHPDTDSLAYLRREGNDKLVYSDSVNTVVLDKTPAKRYWLYISGKYVYIFWWVKFSTHEQKGIKKTGKTLYVNVSDDGGKTFSKAQRLNDHHGVLPDLHVVTDELGHITVLYLDERYKGHQIFTNTSLDGGKKWLEHDVELNQVSKDADEVDKGKERITRAVTPNLQKLGNTLIATWEQVEFFDGKPGLSFYSRTSTDNGLNWSNSELIYRYFDATSIELYMTATNREVYLFAVLNQGVAVFVKEEEGKWQRVKGYMPGTEEAKTDLVSYFKTAFDKDNLYVTYINVEGYRKTDNHTEFQTLNRKNRTWGNKFRFDALEGSAKELSRGYYQDISISKDGSLVVVWEDYRSILPSILMTYSIDKGKTWLSKPIPLNKMGLEGSTHPFIKTLGENKYSIFFRYYVLANAINPKTSTRQITLPSPNSTEFSKIQFSKETLPNKTQSISLLKKRVTALLALREHKNLENMQKEWEFLDPIIKTSQPQLEWLKKRDLFDYMSSKIESITIKGAYAYVKISFTYKIDATFLKGANGSHKEKDNSIKKEVGVLRWGWFYDNWYLILGNPKKSYLP